MNGPGGGLWPAAAPIRTTPNHKTLGVATERTTTNRPTETTPITNQPSRPTNPKNQIGLDWRYQSRWGNEWPGRGPVASRGTNQNNPKPQNARRRHRASDKPVNLKKVASVPPPGPFIPPAASTTPKQNESPNRPTPSTPNTQPTEPPHQPQKPNRA